MSDSSLKLPEEPSATTRRDAERQAVPRCAVARSVGARRTVTASRRGRDKRGHHRSAETSHVKLSWESVATCGNMCQNVRIESVPTPQELGPYLDEHHSFATA